MSHGFRFQRFGQPFEVGGRDIPQEFESQMDILRGYPADERFGQGLLQRGGAVRKRTLHPGGNFHRDE